MRAYFFLCITFFSLSSAMAQLNPFLPAKAVLKTGDTLNNIVGKYKANKTFVYKSDSDKKAIKIDFSKLESVQITNSKGIIDTSYFFKRKDQNTYVKVALLMKGKNWKYMVFMELILDLVLVLEWDFQLEYQFLIQHIIFERQGKMISHIWEPMVQSGGYLRLRCMNIFQIVNY